MTDPIATRLRALYTEWNTPELSPELPHNARLVLEAADTIDALVAALDEVLTISDRKHDAWDRGRAALATAKGEGR